MSRSTPVPGLGIWLVPLLVFASHSHLRVFARKTPLKCPKKCPSTSTCNTVGGAPVCVCPGGQRFVGKKCSRATLKNYQWLDPHNNARAAVGSPSITWNSTIALHAQAWADQLKSSGVCSAANGGMVGDEGQNVYVIYSDARVRVTPTAAVNAWVKKGALYHYQVFDQFSAGCVTGSWVDCGSYTQVIWSNSTLVGCGYADCGGGDVVGTVYVCNYLDGGNVVGFYPY